MISLRTNVDSLNAQTSLKTNSSFQSKTIQQLTSGYRINSSGDDAAGLAVANSYRSTVTELTQGVSNGNDGISQLQIVDGGLNNISSILDRMKTLATQSASGTFTGNRGTLNQEYQQLVTEVTRQATNINLNSGGSLNNLLNVYIGGGASSSSANVSVDLSGNSNAVDATSLGISTSNVLGGGVGISGNTLRMDAPGATFLSANSQSFTFNVYTSAGATTQTVSVGGSGAMTKDQVLDSLNSSLSSLGVSAGLDSNGALQFSGGAAFTVSAGAPGGADDIVSGTGTADNTANYVKNGADDVCWCGSDAELPDVKRLGFGCPSGHRQPRFRNRQDQRPDSELRRVCSQELCRNRYLVPELEQLLRVRKRRFRCIRSRPETTLQLLPPLLPAATQPQQSRP